MAQCDDIHKILLNNLTSIKSHPESLRYLSLRFLSPHRYNGGEWNIICGAHSFENEKNSKHLIPEKIFCIIHTTRYSTGTRIGRAIGQKVVPIKLFTNVVYYKY